jgi:hypothetical protein
VRRSEPVKAYLLIEERVYLGAVQGTIGLRVQNRFNSGRYACTRTFVENGAWGSSKAARAFVTRDLRVGRVREKKPGDLKGLRTSSDRKMDPRPNVGVFRKACGNI